MDSLTDCRRKIDAIDDQLIELFCERMKTALEIAKIKKEEGIAVLNAGREAQILARMAEKAGEALSPYAKTLYTTLFDLSRSYQNAYLVAQSEPQK